MEFYLGGRIRLILTVMSSVGMAFLPRLEAAAQAQAIPIAPSPTVAATMTLQYFIDSALNSGDELQISKKNLASARAQYELVASKNEPSLSAAGSYAISDGIGSAIDASTTLRGILGSLGIAQTVTGTLSLTRGTQSASNPNTKIDLNLTQKFPASTTKYPSDPNTLIGVAANQIILDGYPGGQTRAAVEKALITLKGREIAAVQSKSLVILNVKKAYMTMLAAQRTLATRQRILEKQNAILKQVTAIFAMKQASSIDMQNASINAKTASLDVETARHDLALARQRLANLAGLDGNAEFGIADIPDPAMPAGSLEEAIAKGLSQRAELELAVLNGKSATIDLAVARGQSTATLSVSGGVNLALVWSGPVASAGSANLGIKLGLPIVDAGAAKNLVDSNLALLGVYETQKKQLEKTIATDIRDTFWMVDIQSQKVDLARQSKDLYAAKFAIVKAQNSYGTASLQDLLSASVDSANAEASYETARSAYLLAILALETAMGL